MYIVSNSQQPRFKDLGTWDSEKLSDLAEDSYVVNGGVGFPADFLTLKIDLLSETLPPPHKGE